MKNPIIQFSLLAVLLFFAGCSGSNGPSTWDNSKLDAWFEKGEWMNGWNAAPDPSINRKTLAVSYFNQKERWDKAFEFLKTTNLEELAPGRHDIDGDNLYAAVSEYITKNPEEATYESHRQYVDIQYVVSGKELIGLAPASELKEVLTPYDASKDIEFMTVNDAAILNAAPGRFFLFFPNDLHCPGMKDGENSPVKKVVIKVKID